MNRHFPVFSKFTVVWLTLTIIVTVATEWICIVEFQSYGENTQRDAFSRTAEVAAASFDGSDLSSLSGGAQDVARTEFLQASESLRLIHSAMHQSRFAYLLAQRQGRVVFLADAITPDVKDQSRPGDVYDEASPALKQIFVDGLPIVEGPLSDRWGIWVSALAPVRDPKDGHVAAVFGLDIDATQWNATVGGFRWRGIAVGAALAALEAAFCALIYRQIRLASKLRIASHIIESSSTIIYRVAAKPGFPLTFISDNVHSLGYEAREILASPTIYNSLVHVDDQPHVVAFLQGILEGGGPATIRIRVKNQQGDFRWFENSIRPIRAANGRLLAAEGTLIDINESHELEKRIQIANNLLTTEMETSPDAILVVDGDGRAISHNHRFVAMWDIPPEAIEAGDDGPMLAHVTNAMKDPQAFLSRVKALYADRTAVGHDELETTDGRFIERHSAPLTGEGGIYTGRVWFFRDVTAFRRAEAEIRHTASHDVLTGLPNRRVFLEAVTQAIARVERGDQNFAVLFLDLDHFKDVNDTLGHPAGDELLRAVARRLGETVRATDLVSRFGGDEFAVLMTAIDEPIDAATLAAKLVAAIACPFPVHGSSVRTGVSIGIVVHEPAEADSELLLSHADVALYRAKAEGRGGYRFFTDSMDVEVRTRVNISAELREAIGSDQLFLEYQPQVDIQTGHLVGLEALVRWRHPERGIMQPNDFVPVAEKTGLIGALGQWVMDEACRQTKVWRGVGIVVPRMAVNVSAVQFKMILELEGSIARTLAAAGLPPQALEIELTETAIMEAARGQGDVLQRMRDSGLKFAIDDFGTGYSSLDYLRRFPADRLKVAQDYVKLILVDAGCATIVRAIIRLATELGMVAIAEGVETADQLQLLKDWGCAQAQGFYYARPLGSDEVEVILRRGGIFPIATQRLVLAAVG